MSCDPHKLPSRCPLALLALPLLLSIPLPALAGGWTQPQGDFYLKLWARSLVGSAAYRADGEGSVPTPAFQDHQLNAYLEYGLLDGLTLVGFGAPIGHAFSELGSATYVGPLVAGLRQRLLGGSWNLAVEGHYGLSPGLGDRVLLRQPYTDASGQAAEAVYVAAVDNHRGEIQLQLGHGLGWGWLAAAAGLRLNSAFDHMATGQLQLGLSALAPLRLDLHASLIQPLGDVEITNASGAGETRYLGIGLGAALELSEGFAVSAGFGGAILVRSNAATPSLELGVELY